MDYNKIGDFITSLRKEKKLTQAKLAEKIFVSEKTVSKWENGNGVPDTGSLTKLCEVLGVSINELLSGERITVESTTQNNQLVFNMVKEIEEKNKTIWVSMWVIMFVSIVALLGFLFVSAYLIPEGVWQLVTIIVSVLLFMIPCFYALKLEVSVGAYKCKKCGSKVVPTYTEALNSMHLGTTRYLKCPNCKKRRWCKKVIKKED